MPEMTQKEMIKELYQAVIGIPESPDENGLIGDVKDIKKEFRILNGRVRINETSISRIKGIGIGLGIVTTLSGAGIGIYFLN